MRTFTAVPATTRPATASSANAPEVASPVAGTFFTGLVAAGVGSLEGHSAGCSAAATGTTWLYQPLYESAPVSIGAR